MSEFLLPVDEELKISLAKQTSSGFGERRRIVLPTQEEYEERVRQEMDAIVAGIARPIGVLGLPVRTEHAWFLAGYRTDVGIEKALAENNLPFGIGERRKRTTSECIERYNRQNQTVQPSNLFTGLIKRFHFPR